MSYRELKNESLFREGQIDEDEARALSAIAIARGWAHRPAPQSAAARPPLHKKETFAHAEPVAQVGPPPSTGPAPMMVWFFCCGAGWHLGKWKRDDLENWNLCAAVGWLGFPPCSRSSRVNDRGTKVSIER
jgi:hypothetical protein